MSQVILQLFRETVQLLNIKFKIDPTLELDQVFPPPPHPLVGLKRWSTLPSKSHLNHRDVNGVPTSYPVL
uniref:Uncharacterized protein n=1 Tax=Peronospora matthiolae TaxID=2874970 RepID=A0AAV1U6A8_9STRA